MQKKIFFLALLVATQNLWTAPAPSVEVMSDTAHYQDDALVLEGNVVIQYPLAKLSAQYARVEKNDDQAIPFEKIQLENQVQIQLQDGSSIACDALDFSLEDNQATFRSYDEQSLVHYIHSLDSSTPLKIDSNLIQLHLSEKLLSSARPTNLGQTFQEITATGSVQASYDDNLVAYAENAVYYLREGPDQGKMVLLPNEYAINEKQATCRILYRNNNFLQAKKIIIDPKSHAVYCHEVEATFYNTNSARPIPIHLTCDLIEWSQNSNNFICSGNVYIKDEELGEISSPSRTIISCLPLQSSKNLRQHLVQKIHFEKDVTIRWQTNEENRTLHTPGSAIFDRINLIAIFQKNTLNSTEETQQILLEDSFRNIRSNLFTIYYRYNAEGKLNPQRYILEGNISVKNLEAKGTNTQHLWAQRIESDPEFQEMKLLSLGKEPVLFYDPLKNLQMSAKGLVITRGTDQESSCAKGIGHVRFNLNQKEFEKLKGAATS